MSTRFRAGCIVCREPTRSAFVMYMGGQDFFRIPYCIECRENGDSIRRRLSALASLRALGRVHIRATMAFFRPEIDVEFEPL